MVGCPRPNRWLVEPDSTARFTQRALVRMKERTKALLSKNQNELSAARELYVSLDRADNVIEGGAAFQLESVFGVDFKGGPSFVALSKGWESSRVDTYSSQPEGTRLRKLVT